MIWFFGEDGFPIVKRCIILPHWFSLCVVSWFGSERSTLRMATQDYIRGKESTVKALRVNHKWTDVNILMMLKRNAQLVSYRFILWSKHNMNHDHDDKGRHRWPTYDHSEISCLIIISGGSCWSGVGERGRHLSGARANEQLYPFVLPSVMAASSRACRSVQPHREPCLDRHTQAPRWYGDPKTRWTSRRKSRLSLSRLYGSRSRLPLQSVVPRRTPGSGYQQLPMKPLSHCSCCPSSIRTTLYAHMHAL